MAEPESSMTLALVRLSERQIAHTPRLPAYKTPFEQDVSPQAPSRLPQRFLLRWARKSDC